jgi:hypothetical protein
MSVKECQLKHLSAASKPSSLTSQICWSQHKFFRLFCGACWHISDGMIRSGTEVEIVMEDEVEIAGGWRSAAWGSY